VARERVITGEAVEVELPIARLATRTVALVLDALVQAGATAVLIGTLAMLSVAEVDTALLASIAVLGVVLIFLVWPVTLETLTRGRSLGKLAMGLRVVRDDGGPIRFRHAFTRGLVGMMLEWPGLLAMPLTWAIGAGTLLMNSKGKRLGDLAAGTMVLQERLPDLGQAVAGMPPQLAPWAASLDLTGVDDDLAMTIRQFLSRAQELRAEARTALGQRLVDEVLAVTTPAPPPGTPGWWYLTAVLAERRRREEARLARLRSVVALGAPPRAPRGTHPLPATAPPQPSTTGYQAPA
jgi:uncharacterized RDD family membrane protein YckC